MPRRLLHGGLSVVVVVVGLWFATPAVPVAAQGAAVTPVAPPPGAEGLGAAWYSVPGPGGRTLLLAVYDPRTAPGQAVPAVLVLHDTHGFATQYLQVAQALAAQTGYVVAAGCWFDGVGLDVDTSPVTPLRCPGSPAFVGATPTAWPTVRALGEAVRQYAGGAQLGLFGHGRGAEVALQVASAPETAGLTVQAVVASSSVYSSVPATASYDTPTPLALAPALTAPVLILHGQADTMVHVSNATLYYDRLQREHKTAQCVVYPRFGHDALLHTTPADAPESHVFVDGVRRSAGFFGSVFQALASVHAADCLPA